MGVIKRHTFDNWFPMRDFPAEGVVGAYTWLNQRGYGSIVQEIRYNPGMPNKNFRRLPLVGLIYEKSLIDEFLKTCWTQGNRSLMERQKRMDQFYRWFKNRPGLVQWLHKYL